MVGDIILGLFVLPCLPVEHQRGIGLGWVRLNLCDRPLLTVASRQHNSSEMCTFIFNPLAALPEASIRRWLYGAFRLI